MHDLTSTAPPAFFHGHLRRWPSHEDHSLEFLRVLSAAEDGASTVCECLTTAERIVPGDDESWHREWKATDEASRKRGERASAAGHKATACMNWLRASNYFRTAEIFLDAGDARREFMLGKMRSCSQRYLEKLDLPGEIVKIPNIDGSTMEAYLLSATEAPAKMQVVLCIGGWDDFKDEHLSKLPRHALDRGISLLLVELPKVSHRRRTRFERFYVASSIEFCVDYLVKRHDVDEKRIAIYGLGLGASFATQAAVLDRRFSAAVCDGGMLDLNRRAFALQRLVDPEGSGSVEPYLNKLAHHSVAKQIRCPVLVPIHDDVSRQSAGSIGNLAAHHVVAASGLKSDSRLSTEYIFDWIGSRFAEVGDEI